MKKVLSQQYCMTGTFHAVIAAKHANPASRKQGLRKSLDLRGAFAENISYGHRLSRALIYCVPSVRMARLGSDGCHDSDNLCDCDSLFYADSSPYIADCGGDVIRVGQ